MEEWNGGRPSKAAKEVSRIKLGESSEARRKQGRQIQRR